MTFASRCLLALAVLLAGACSDNRGGSGKINIDGSPQQKDISAYGKFLEACTEDYQCISGLCVEFGPGDKRCSTSCQDNAGCLAYAGWNCDTQREACFCVVTGKRPDQCNVDGDCDGEPDRPVSDETCNDKDDDCNGEIDDVAPNTTGAKLYYQDADGDGFGNSFKGKWLCKEAAGWVLDGSDCNDDAKNAYPGGVEICGDKIDNDCDQDIEDTDVCGLTPIVVTDIKGGLSSQLESCDLDGSVGAAYDIKEIVAKQDKTYIKYTVRLRGAPSTNTCSTYKLTFGDATSLNAVVYVYRPAVNACQPLPLFEAYAGGQPFTSQASWGFNAADPGHVSFVIPKAEIFPKIPDPTYQLRACTNAVADATKDITDCTTDSCVTPVHR